MHLDKALAAAKTPDHATHHRLPVLDGVRGFAVLYVILFHFFGGPLDAAGSVLRPLYAVVDLGFTGVDLFFVLSGFLITGILLANLGSDRYFTSFYARRVLRIFPLYYLLCAVCILIIPATPFFARYNYFWDGAPGSSIFYWMFLNDLGLLLPVRYNLFLNQCWSLAIEEQFYLLWPLLVWMLDKRRALHVSATLFVASAVLRNVLYYGFDANGGLLYGAPFTHLEAISLGSIIAILLTEPERYRRVLRLLGAQWKLSLPALIAAAIYSRLFPIAGLSNLISYPVIVTVGSTLSALVYGGLLLHCLSGRSFLTRLLSAAPMRQCGKYSYAMYLLNVPCWFVSVKLCFGVARITGIAALESPVVVFAVGLPLTYLLAALSWRFLESKANALKDRFSYGRSDGAKARRCASSALS